MFRHMRRSALVVSTGLLMAAVAQAQTQSDQQTLSIRDHPGQATIIQFQGREFVDVQDLAEITKGSLNFENDGIVLTLPTSDDPEHEGSKRGFSRDFMKAAIESMASIREWGGMLAVTVQNHYPVENATVGNSIIAYQERAADTVRLASAAASTDSDRQGLELLRSEFSHLQAWSDKLVAARNSLTATQLTTSESPLLRDEEAQKLLHCGRFLSQMFASGTFEDDADCH